MQPDDFFIFEYIVQPPVRYRIYWTDMENTRFLEALHKFGRSDARAISQHVGTRTPAQIHSHAQKHYARVDAIFYTASYVAERVYYESTRYFKQILTTAKAYTVVSRTRFPVCISPTVSMYTLLTGFEWLFKRFGPSISIVVPTIDSQSSVETATDASHRGDLGANASAAEGMCDDISGADAENAIRLTAVALLPEGHVYRNTQGYLCYNGFRFKDIASMFLLGFCTEPASKELKTQAFQMLLVILQAWKEFVSVQYAEIYKIKDIAKKVHCADELVCCLVLCCAMCSVKE